MVHEVRWPDGRVVPVSEDKWAAARWFCVSEGVYDVRIGSRNFRVERTSMPEVNGRMVLRINGVTTEVRVADKRMLLLEKMGMAAAVTEVERELLAPMPGKVLSVRVEAGVEVKAGDAVAVLEAMKMENLIRSPRSGVVSAVAVVAGQAVEKGAVLLTYENA